MKTKKTIKALLAIALVFGMTIAGCDNGSTSDTGRTDDTGGTNGTGSPGGLNGTWYSYGNVQKYYFDHWNYEYTYNGNPYRKGTYTTTTDSMTMTTTHVGSSYYSSSYTWLESSKWYSKDEFKAAYINYYRDQYRSQYQQTYDSYVANYGAATANSIFQSAYGTTNIDSIVDKMINQSQIGNSIDPTLNQLYTSNTVAYSLSGSTLILGGVSLTRG